VVETGHVRSAAVEAAPVVVAASVLLKVATTMASSHEVQDVKQLL